MRVTLREFIVPDGRGGWKPDDKAWLADRVLSFIVCMRHERAYLTGKIRTRSNWDIYSEFAPISGHPFAETRPSWDRKNRRVKRQMLAAVIRRLIADGKIRIDSEHYPNNKSMHGLVVSQRKSDVHLFGSDYDGIVQTYTETNALQALADALGAE